VTFVSGTNGSGKSAVLQALQCCLGVRANATGRAKSFQKVRGSWAEAGLQLRPASACHAVAMHRGRWKLCSFGCRVQWCRCCAPLMLPPPSPPACAAHPHWGR
jgi:hypothetical protein